MHICSQLGSVRILREERFRPTGVGLRANVATRGRHVPVVRARLCPAIQTAALKVHVEGAGIVSKSGSQEDTRRAALRRGRSAAKQRSSALRHGASAPSGALRPRRSAALLQVLEIDTGISSQNPPPFMSTQLPGKAQFRERGRVREGADGRGRLSVCDQSGDASEQQNHVQPDTSLTNQTGHIADTRSPSSGRRK